MDRGTTKLGMDKIKAASESAAKTSMTLTKSAVSSSVNLTMSAVSSSVDMTKSAASVTTQATTSAVQGTLNMTKSSAAMAGTIGRQGMTGLASLPGGEQAVHLTNRSITMTAKAAKGTFYLGQRGISGTVDAALKATDMATDMTGTAISASAKALALPGGENALSHLTEFSSNLVLHTHAHARTHAHRERHTQTHAHAHAHARTHTHTHTHTHAHAHAHAHTLAASRHLTEFSSNLVLLSCARSSCT